MSQMGHLPTCQSRTLLPSRAGIGPFRILKRRRIIRWFLVAKKASRVRRPMHLALDDDPKRDPPLADGQPHRVQASGDRLEQSNDRKRREAPSNNGIRK
jgi:hypothetical protein